MSKHVERKATVATITTWKCDFCDKNAIAACDLCGRNVCFKHRHKDYPCDGNYRDIYCLQCWKIGEPHREKQKKAREGCDEMLERIKKDWREKAIAAKEK